MLTDADSHAPAKSEAHCRSLGQMHFTVRTRDVVFPAANLRGKVWRPLLFQCLLPLCMLQACGFPESRQFSRAVEAGTQDAFELFLMRYPDGKHTTTARLYLSGLRARMDSSLPAHTANLVEHWLASEISPHETIYPAVTAQASLDFVRTHLEADAQVCPSVQSVWIDVSERYEEAPRVVVLDSYMRDWFTQLRIPLATDPARADLEFTAVVRGQPIGGFYSNYGWSWAGAWVEGSWTINRRGGWNRQAEFTGGERAAPEGIFVPKVEAGRSWRQRTPPSTSLFQRALTDSRFYESLSSALLEVCDMRSLIFPLERAGAAGGSFDAALLTELVKADPDSVSLWALAAQALGYSNHSVIELLALSETGTVDSVLVAALWNRDRSSVPVLQALTTRPQSALKVTALARFLERRSLSSPALQGDHPTTLALNALRAIGIATLDSMANAGVSGAEAARRILLRHGQRR